MIRLLCSLFAWRVVHETACWHYEENFVTGARRIRRSQPYGYEPVAYSWLSGARPR